MPQNVLEDEDAMFDCEVSEEKAPIQWFKVNAINNINNNYKYINNTHCALESWFVSFVNEQVGNNNVIFILHKGWQRN